MKPNKNVVKSPKFWKLLIQEITQTIYIELEGVYTYIKVYIAKQQRWIVDCAWADDARNGFVHETRDSLALASDLWEPISNTSHSPDETKQFWQWQTL